MSNKILEDYRILIVVGEDYEDLELWYPKLRLEEAGAEVILAGQKKNNTYHGKHGYPATSEALIDEMESKDFQGIVCAGGWMPDKLRRDPRVLSLLQEFHKAGKMVAAICHGGWMPISAGIYKGITVTGSPGIRDDLINAGAVWKDLSVVIDKHFVSSRRPDDLPDFCCAMIEVLQRQPLGVQ